VLFSLAFLLLAVISVCDARGFSQMLEPSPKPIFAASLALKPFNSNEQAHLFTMMSKRNVSLPTAGSLYPLGVYFAEMGVGSGPLTYFHVALDTGSGDLILPGEGCSGCDPRIPKYNASASVQSGVVSCSASSQCDNYSIFGCSAQCTFSLSYETCVLANPTQVCTMNGVVFNDLVHVGGMKVPLTIGAIQAQTPDYHTQEGIGGLVGLAGATDWHKPILPTALAQLGYIDDAFAFCFMNATNGLFMLGGAAPSTFVQSSLVWLPMRGQYNVAMTGLAIGGVPIQFSQQDVVLDSGTNIILLDDTTFGNFLAQLTSCTNCAHVNGLSQGNCYALTSAQIAAYPSLKLSFTRGFTSVVPPTSYLVPHTLKGGLVCLAVTPSNGGPTILGDTFFFQHTIIFDRQNQRVGFATVNKAKCQ
jgi:hypothetical protein